MRGDSFMLGDMMVVEACNHVLRGSEGIIMPSEWGPIRCEVCDGPVLVEAEIVCKRPGRSMVMTGIRFEIDNEAVE